MNDAGIEGAISNLHGIMRGIEGETDALHDQGVPLVSEIYEHT
jgi:hypothetical protein